MIKLELLSENQNFGGKNSLAAMSLTAFQYLKTFLMISAVILINVICLILCKEMCLHVEELYNSVH